MVEEIVVDTKEWYSTIKRNEVLIYTTNLNLISKGVVDLHSAIAAMPPGKAKCKGVRLHSIVSTGAHGTTPGEQAKHSLREWSWPVSLGKKCADLDRLGGCGS